MICNFTLHGYHKEKVVIKYLRIFVATPVCKVCYTRNEDDTPVLLALEKRSHVTPPLAWCRHTDATLANSHSCKQVTTQHENKRSQHTIECVGHSKQQVGMVCWYV